MDIKKVMIVYRSFSRKEKKNLCSTILSRNITYGGIFRDLWDFIEQDTISDEDLDIIYECGMTALSDEKREKFEDSIKKLSNLNSHLLLVTQQEEMEKESEQSAITESIRLSF